MTGLLCAPPIDFCRQSVGGPAGGPFHSSAHSVVRSLLPLEGNICACEGIYCSQSKFSVPGIKVTLNTQFFNEQK